MNLNPAHRRDKGGVLLVIIVLIFVLLLLGYTLWQIWKMIHSMEFEPPDPKSVAGDMLPEFRADHPGEAVVVSTQVVTMTVSQPFEAALVNERIWRSTNLINWEIVGTNTIGDAWTDTNAPWPNAFYKREIIP